MRVLPILLISLASACAGGDTKINGFVLDQEHVLTPAQHSALDSLFRAHEVRTGNEIALVTHPTFNGKTAKDFAVGFGDSAGVGKKDRDNGVLIAFSKTRREVFIATGKGTEKVLPDSICRRIIDLEMLPRFKENEDFNGLWAGSKAMVDLLERPENAIR